MKLRLRHITTGLQRPSFPSITHADLSPSPISSRKQHLLCTICRTLAVPFTLPFLLSSFLFFSFRFLCFSAPFWNSFAAFFIYRLGTFFSFFPFVPFSPYIIFWFSFSGCTFLLSSRSLFCFVATFRSIENRSKIEIGSFRWIHKKKKKKEKIPSARNARRCSPSPLVFLFWPSFHLRRVSLLFAFLPRGPYPSSLASSLASYLYLSLIRITLRVSLSGIRGRNNGDTCPRSEASHMNGSFIRCNGVL